jgi:hypothetical protein
LRTSGRPWLLAGRPGFGATSTTPSQLLSRRLERPTPPALLGGALRRWDAHRSGGSAIS